MTQPTSDQNLTASTHLSRKLNQELEAKQYANARAFADSEGVSVIHLRKRLPDGEGGEFLSLKGGMTIAYRQLPSQSFVELSTAICSDKDNYSRKLGTIHAVEQFANARTIRVPLFGQSPLSFLSLFTDYLEYQAAREIGAVIL